MAGLKGNVGWLLASKQTVKGTPAVPVAANAHKVGFTGGDIGPTREVDNLSETDSNRDQGDSYVVTTGVEGSPEFYVRAKSIGFWLFAALGADAPTGTMPNFTHTITPSNTIPYITAWKMIGDTLFETFADCKVSSLGISAEAGQPLVATANLVGRGSVRTALAVDNAVPIALDNGSVFNYNNAAVTLGGGATALVRSFDMTIENNVTAQQTDDSIPYDVVEGLRVVSLGFDLIFEDLVEYNKFHYGGAAGTIQSPDVFTTSAAFVFTKDANTEISFTFPKIAYQEFPVEPDPGGDPIVASVRAVAQRNVPVLTTVVKNSVATY